MGESFKLGAAEDREESTWVPIPDDTFLTARVTDVKTVKKGYQSKDDGSDVYRVEWKFEITEDGDFKGREVKGETSTSFVKHPGCKMFMWVQSVFGRELPDEFEFEPESIVGAEVRVHMECKEGGEKKDVKGVGTGEYWINNRVKDVLSASKVPQGSAYADDGEEPF